MKTLNECPVCGKEFDQGRSNRKCCSSECREIRRKIEEKRKLRARKRVCPVCKKEFEASHMSRKYCSDDCKRIRDREYARNYYREHKEEYAPGGEKSEKAKGWAKRNREHLRNYQRNYYWTHREHILKRAKKWRDANPEKMKAYRKKQNEKRKRERAEGKSAPNARERIGSEAKQIRTDTKEAGAFSYVKPKGCGFKGDCLNCPFETCVDE